MSSPEANLSALGITLPEPMAAVANYVPFVITGQQLFVSGQVSAGPAGLVKGRLGATMTLEDGFEPGQTRRQIGRVRQRAPGFRSAATSHQWLLGPDGRCVWRRWAACPLCGCKPGPATWRRR